MRLDHIRNFCIVAHIDHGKSTLADRLLEHTATLDKRQMRKQVLDDNDLERERGITIKLHAVRMAYRASDGVEYEINLIDTPGHVDFTYEVSRSLAACEGAVLVVDATQGVQAQTLSNLFLALDAGLEIVPVLNKIDLPGAEPERRRDEVADLLGVDPETVLMASAKEGIGIGEILEAIVTHVPAPKGDIDAPLRALIFDSYYDKYLGAVPSIRVIDGFVETGTRITFGNVDRSYEVTEVGHLRLGRKPQPRLTPGEVGYLVAAIKEVGDTRVGDTILDADNRAETLLEGYKEARPMVFAGLYPSSSDDYEDLRDALERLKLNDASLHYEAETSIALGFGFRCGFLGLLHMEIIQERLEREFGVDLITTVPNVQYHVTLTDGEELHIESPTALPDPARIAEISEPIVKAHILCPAEYIGNVQKLCHERRGVFKGMSYPDPQRVEINFELPLSEIVLDFYDRLKSGTRGYAALDYDFLEYRAGDMVKIDVLINGDPVDAFSVIIHRYKALEYGRDLVRKLKDLIPRQQYEVALQATIGNNVIARTNVKALRKNVTAKCYGGDISRKRKLLEKQKAGKKRMKQVGSVEIPQEAFLAVLNLSGNDRSPGHGGGDRRVVRAPNHLGDVVMALPALAEQGGDVMARAWLTPLLEMAAIPGRILSLEPGWHGWRKAVSALRRGRYSRGTLLTPSFSAAWLFRWGGVGDLRGTASDGRSWLLRERVDRKVLLAHHRIEQYRMLLGRETGPAPAHFRLVVPTDTVELWRSRLGPSPAHVGLFPGSNAPARRWPADRFAAVARRLLAEGFGVVVLGGEGERALTQAVSAAAPGAVDLGGETELAGLAAVLSACRVVVTNDTGPMHLAAALGVPTVTLWGPSDPAEVAPPGPAHALLTGPPLPCVPCFKHHCPRSGPGTMLPRGHEECMHLIDVDPVVSAALALLERKTP